MSKTVNDLYLELRRKLKDADIFSSALEAREICAFACELNKNNIASWGHIYISDETERKANELLNRRLKDEPLAYLIGEWDFYGLTFKITRDVLIPRSDTESLCELAINKANEIVNPKILDICCGSGCIGIAIAKNVNDCKVVGADVSSEALSISRQNARFNDVTSRYVAVKTNALEPYDGKMGQFHIIVSNPPYITKEEFFTLDNSVKKYEPMIALFGGDDGLVFYRNIAQYWKSALLPGGYILFECGYRQATLVADVLDKCGYSDIEICEDLSGVQRIVKAVNK